MFPYIHLGSLTLGTFGLLLWFAAVCAAFVLHLSFVRFRVEADALNIVALVTLFGILGAKLWHELQAPAELAAAFHQMMLPGLHHPGAILLGFLQWFKAGFAWFGGMLVGVATLCWQGHTSRFKGSLQGTPGERVGALRMLDLAAPAAAVGYGVGRLGCLTSGDGDYGIKTTLPWGVHMRPDALVPTPDLVQPTPIYEFLFSLLVFWIMWQLAKRFKPVGWLTGLYLILSGLGRFLVEFVRINPKIYFGDTMSNAQVAALGTIVAGGLLMAWAARRNRQGAPALADDPLT